MSQHLWMMIPRLVTDSLETVKRVCSKALLIFTTGSTFPKSSSPSSSLSRMQRLAVPSSYVPLLFKHPERLALMGEGKEEVEMVLHSAQAQQGQQVEGDCWEDGRGGGMGACPRPGSLPEEDAGGGDQFVRHLAWLRPCHRQADKLDHILLVARASFDFVYQVGCCCCRCAQYHKIVTRSEVVNDFFLLHGVTATWALTEQVFLIIKAVKTKMTASASRSSLAWTSPTARGSSNTSSSSSLQSFLQGGLLT